MSKVLTSGGSSLNRDLSWCIKGLQRSLGATVASPEATAKLSYKFSTPREVFLCRKTLGECWKSSVVSVNLVKPPLTANLLLVVNFALCLSNEVTWNQKQVYCKVGFLTCEEFAFWCTTITVNIAREKEEQWCKSKEIYKIGRRRSCLDVTPSIHPSIHYLNPLSSLPFIQRNTELCKKGLTAHFWAISPQTREQKRINWCVKNENWANVLTSTHGSYSKANWRLKFGGILFKKMADVTSVCLLGKTTTDVCSWFRQFQHILVKIWIFGA